MKFPELCVHLSMPTRKGLEEAGWPLIGRVDALRQASEAEVSGWQMFPLAAEFLSVFDGVGTDTEEEFFLEAWKAVPIQAEDHATLRGIQRRERLFPVGLAAGWVNLLLTEQGLILASLNGRIQSGGTIDSVVNNMISQRERDAMERNK